MLQDIAPKVFDNQYDPHRQPQPGDVAIIATNGQIRLKDDQTLPLLQEARDRWSLATNQVVYLFSIDQTGFYWLDAELPATVGYQDVASRTFTHYQPAWQGYAVATAVHLVQWYQTNRYCGRCGHALHRATTERALVCPDCGLTLYPRISPAIMVGVVDHDRLLLTKFIASNSYQHHTLISGYAEIGETLEAAVHREVREEVGLAVHNLRYYGSQPWGLSGSLLAGFFADLDQAAPIALEADELSQATWFDRADLPKEDTTVSLAWQMIEDFRHRRV